MQTTPASEARVHTHAKVNKSGQSYRVLLQQQKNGLQRDESKLMEIYDANPWMQWWLEALASKDSETPAANIDNSVVGVVMLKTVRDMEKYVATGSFVQALKAFRQKIKENEGQELVNLRHSSNVDDAAAEEFWEQLSKCMQFKMNSADPNTETQPVVGAYVARFVAYALALPTFQLVMDPITAMLTVVMAMRYTISVVRTKEAPNPDAPECVAFRALQTNSRQQDWRDCNECQSIREAYMDKTEEQYVPQAVAAGVFGAEPQAALQKARTRLQDVLAMIEASLAATEEPPKRRRTK